MSGRKGLGAVSEACDQTAAVAKGQRVLDPYRGELGRVEKLRESLWRGVTLIVRED